MLFKRLPEEYDGDAKYYQISRCGVVRSISKITNKKMILSQFKNGGYLKSSLSSKPQLIHRLVAIVFIPKPENFDSTYTVDHIDNEDKTNNHVYNLRWSTNENQTRNQRKKIRQQIDSMPLIATSTDGDIVHHFDSSTDAIKTIRGALKSKISACINGQRNKHAGYTWSTPKSDSDLPGELWKLYNDVYQYKVYLSNLGRISFEFRNGYTKKLSSTDKSTTRSIEDDRYPKISVKGKTKYLHVAVWELFNGKKPMKMVINHIDHDKRNASLDNLELITQSKNMISARHAGRYNKKV